MASLQQIRVSDISFTIDSSLNVISANRDFLRFFNVSDYNTNLRYFLDRESISELVYFLSNYNGGRKVFFSRVYAREEKLDCILIVKNAIDYKYEMNLLVIDYLYELYNQSSALNLEYKAVLTNQLSYYFIYDILNNSIILKNTKDLAVVYEGDYNTFKAFFIKYFDINNETEITKETLNKLEYDIANNYFEKIYKFLLKNENYITINTKLLDEDNKIIIGNIGLSDNELFIKNDYADKRDGLTGLYNKVTITEMAKNRILNKLDTSLLIIDLDKFKECNDMYGHAYGDKVILTAARIIYDSVKNIGYAGRIGGDEFLCIIEPTDEDTIRRVTKDIRLGIQWGIEAYNLDSVVTCSIGVARYPLNCDNYDSLFDLADKCLYIAKNKGRNNYVIYKPEIHSSVLKKNEDIINDKLSGKYFIDYFNFENEILGLLDCKKKNHKKICDLILKYFEIDRITVYDSKYNIVLSSDSNDVNFRRDYLEHDYFRYFNSHNFLIMDNTNTLDTLDKEKYDMYLSDNIASTIEIVKKDKNGKVTGLICFDKHKPAKTFTNEQIIFALHIANKY